MSLAGVLRSSTNTGLETELVNVFATPLTISSNQPIAQSESLNLKVISAGQTAQRWEIETAIVPTNETPETLIHSVLMGHHSTIYIRMPQPYLASGVESYTGAPAIHMDAPRGSTALQIDSGTVKAGQFINFSGTSEASKKVYLITSANAPSAGVQDITIQPPLRESIFVGNLLKCGEKTTLRALYSNDSLLGVTYEDGVLAGSPTVKYKEKL